ncbi:MAG: hypothetical protein ACK4GQ_00770 [Candidatus Hadarchaeales archaeon]
MYGKILVSVIVALVFLHSAPPMAQENTARIYGRVYYWFTLEPMPGAIVTISTTPEQRMVAENGDYSFDVPLGVYEIKAEYFLRGTLIYEDSENVEVLAPGDYRLDFLLFPVSEELDIYENIAPEVEVGEGDGLVFLIAVGGVVVLILAVFLAVKRRRKTPALQPASVKVVGLPEDLQEIVNLLRESGGRMNQVELRRKLPYSEAKVSLMLSDLEDRKIIRKVRKGRANIIILTELG